MASRIYWIKKTTGFKTMVVLLFATLISCSAQKDSLFSEIGVCTDITNADTLKSFGYSYIEESVGRFLVPQKSNEEFDEILQNASKSALKVKACNSFIPGNMKCVGPDAVPSQILKFADIAFNRAQKAGVEFIVFGSGASRQIPEGFSHDKARLQFISLCDSMALIANNYNVVVLLEPLNKKECNFINSVAEGGEIVKEINHPNIRLLADIYHMLVENEPPDNIIKYEYLIKHVHIAEKQDRAAPGTNNEDFRPYFNALQKAGYTGKLSVECKWNDLGQQAGTTIESIKSQL